MDDSERFHGIPKEEIFKQLISDRDHHFSHPQSVNLKAGVSAATLCVTAMVAFATDTVPFSPNLLGICFIIAGLIIMCWGLWAHNAMHVRQRIRLERIIQEAITTETSLGDIFGRYGSEGIAGHSIPVFATEPDRRPFVTNHDFRIFGGIALLVAATIVCAQPAKPEKDSDEPLKIQFESALKIEGGGDRP